VANRVKKHSGSPEALVCSFCQRNQESVGKLIASPGDPRTYICDECIATCNAILEDDQAAASKAHPPMKNPNECEHMWQGDFLWVAVSLENPANQKSDQPVEYVPLERCIHCGLLRLTDGSHETPDPAS
jgi:hypothetical protein